VNNRHPKNLPMNENNLATQQIKMPGKSAKGINYHVMDTVWNPEQLTNETPLNPLYNGYRSPDQNITVDNANIQSFAAVVMARGKQKALEENRVYAVDIVEPNESTMKTKNPADTMVSWTQQLQERLKNKETRPISASSTNQLIPSENTNKN
jgi:hypothetical protein